MASSFIPESEAGSRQVAPFAFDGTLRLPKAELQAMQECSEQFAHKIGESLSTYLRSQVSVELAEVAQISYGEFLARLSPQGLLGSLDFVPPETCGLLEMDPHLVFSLIELLLGGSGGPSMAQRRVTDIEQTLLDEFIGLICQEFPEPWKGIADSAPVFAALRDDTQRLQALPGMEMLVTAALQLKLEEGGGILTLALPARLLKRLEPAFDFHRSASRGAGPDSQGLMLQRIQPARVGCEVTLSGATVKIGDLMDLRNGDILALEKPIDTPLAIVLGNGVQFRGQLVQSGRKKAFLVADARHSDET